MSSLRSSTNSVSVPIPILEYPVVPLFGLLMDSNFLEYWKLCTIGDGKMGLVRFSDTLRYPYFAEMLATSGLIKHTPIYSSDMFLPQRDLDLQDELDRLICRGIGRNAYFNDSPFVVQTTSKKRPELEDALEKFCVVSGVLLIKNVVGEISPTLQQDWRGQVALMIDVGIKDEILAKLPRFYRYHHDVPRWTWGVRIVYFTTGKEELPSDLLQKVECLVMEM